MKMTTISNIKEAMNDYPDLIKYKDHIKTPLDKDESHIFFINDCYMIKAYKELKRLDYLEILHEQLHKEDVFIAYPIRNHDHKLFTKIDGGFIVVFHYIKGQPLSETSDKRSISKLIGKAIALLHNALTRVEGSKLHIANLDNTYQTFVLPNIKSFYDELDYLKFEKMLTPFYEKTYVDLEKQIIHRDMHLDNMIITPNEHIGFIDFDIHEMNTRVFDLCYLMTSLYPSFLREENGVDHWLQFMKGVICSYHQVNPLSDKERLAIPYIMLTIPLVFVAWTHGKETFIKMQEENREMALDMFELTDQIVRNIVI